MQIGFLDIQKKNHIDWLISLYFLYENKHYIPVVAANQFPAGVTPGTALDQYKEVFSVSKYSTIFYDWCSENFKNTYVSRFLRLKLTHLYLEIWKIYYSGFWSVREDLKHFKVKIPFFFFVCPLKSLFSRLETIMTVEAKSNNSQNFS